MEGEDLSLRVASFSCYLNPEDSFVQKIWPGSSNLKISKTKAVADGVRVNNNFTFNAASSRPVQDPTVAFILPQQHIINPSATRNPKPSKNEDAKVSIFKADNYFNTTSDYATVPGGIKYANLQGQEDYSQHKHRIRSYNFKSATPSVCSESSSSLSSQMALLPNIIKHKKGIGRRLFLGFGCRGPCSDKKAVFISQSKGMEHFATNCGSLREENSIGEPRKSLEVFGADKVIEKGGVAGNLERKLSMLTWDAIPNPNAQKNPPATICDDRVSDASSDLFEIEDISSSTGYGYVASQTTGYTYGCSSPTQYAPSEASIQWSVVTASAADYASVVSDYCEEKCSSAAGHDTIRRAAKAKNTAIAKPSLKSRSGGLLGCNSHKAVSVVQTVPRTADYQQPKLGNHAELSFARNA